MRKIGIESGAYLTVTGDVQDAFKRMRAHGFNCVDLDLSFTYKTPDSIYHQPEGEFERILTNIRDAAEKSSIEIYQTHGPWRHPPKDATEEDRAEWSDYMKKCIYGNSVLGCRYMVVHPIMPFGTGAEPDSEMFYKLNFEFFKGLAPVAKQYGVVICVENMPFAAHSLARPKEIADFVNDLNDDCFAMCLDTGHSAVLGVSAADGVRIMGDKLRALHVHDNDGKGDRHECPFFGVIDWEEFKKALKETVDESVPLMLETRPGRNIPAEIRQMFLPAFAAAARYLAN